MALTDEQKRMLSEGIPGDAVAQREGAGGMKLDYVETWWIIAELNRILGPDGWSFSVLRQEWAQPVTTNDRGKLECSYVVTGRIELTDGTHREDMGFGSGFGRKAADAIESATKEAVSDCIKRCARQLGHRTGGALYDKQRTHVDDRDDAGRAAMAMVADLRAEAEAGSGSAVAAAKAVAEHRGAIVSLPKQHKATVLEDLTAVAELVAEGDARAKALEWITGQKMPEKAA